MKLLPEWRRVLRRAWSLRLMALAGLLTGLEAVINVVGIDGLPIPNWARALVLLIVIGGAFVARLVVQNHPEDGDGR